MSDNPSSAGEPTELTREQLMSALFASLLIQQTNMALMLLGRVPNPETGERVQDLDAARTFIDMVEMLEAKTKGNLDKREEQLLKQSLTTLHMAFVEAVEAAPSEPQSKAAPQPSQPSPQTTPSPGAESTPAPGDDDAHRKKFSKKY
jgi:hypothetical protein